MQKLYQSVLEKRSTPHAPISKHQNEEELQIIFFKEKLSIDLYLLPLLPSYYCSTSTSSMQFQIHFYFRALSNL